MRAGCGLLVSISGAAKPGSIASFPRVVNWVPPTMHPMRTVRADYDYGHFVTGGDHCCQRPDSTAACRVAAAEAVLALPPASGSPLSQRLGHAPGNARARPPRAAAGGW